MDGKPHHCERAWPCPSDRVPCRSDRVRPPCMPTSRPHNPCSDLRRTDSSGWAAVCAPSHTAPQARSVAVMMRRRYVGGARTDVHAWCCLLCVVCRVLCVLRAVCRVLCALRAVWCGAAGHHVGHRAEQERHSPHFVRRWGLHPGGRACCRRPRTPPPCSAALRAQCMQTGPAGGPLVRAGPLRTRSCVLGCAPVVVGRCGPAFPRPGCWAWGRCRARAASTSLGSPRGPAMPRAPSPSGLSAPGPALPLWCGWPRCQG
jgi:hypothetical protein